MRRLALLALLGLAACQQRTSEVIPGADAEAQRATAARTREDLVAASEASATPLAEAAPRPAARRAPTRLLPEQAPRLPVAEDVLSEEPAPAAQD